MSDFREIVNSVSFSDLVKDYDKKRRSEIAQNNEKNLSVEEQKFYLAYYAKMASEHVGFENFSKENQDGFKSHIVGMYNRISGERKQGEFLEEMGESAKFIEDRHFEIGIGKNEAARGGEKKEIEQLERTFVIEQMMKDLKSMKN